MALSNADFSSLLRVSARAATSPKPTPPHPEAPRNTVPPYVYERLHSSEDIRLLRLDTAKDLIEPLSCTLTHQRRSTKITAADYSAISYTWGEPHYSHSLQVRNEKDDTVSQIKITANVDALLRRLRSFERHPLWIDAICLNQCDDEEKTHQIPLMRNTYRKAKTVHIWVGDHDEQTPALFHCLRRLSRIPQGLTNEETSEKIVKTCQQIFGRSKEPGSLVTDGVRFIATFSQRMWFSRRWTIQEACLARSALVHCGASNIPLETLVLAANRFLCLEISSYELRMMTHLRPPTSDLSILELLYRFHQANCLEPRDRVAALYGLLKGEHRFELDFSVHWTKLYKGVAEHILLKGCQRARLELLLHLFEFGSLTDSHLPQPADSAFSCWVPDWSARRRRRLPLFSKIRTTDTLEEYACLQAVDPPTTIELSSDGQGMQVSWTISCDIKGHACLQPVQCCQQVTCTWKLGKDRHHRQQEGDLCPTTSALSEKLPRLLIRLLLKMFPNAAESTAKILALSHLLQAVGEFANLKPPEPSKEHDTYMKQLSRDLPFLTKADSTGLRSLLLLPIIMDNNCFFSVGKRGADNAWNPQGGIAHALYGLSSHQVMLGDILVPLWDVDIAPHKYHCTKRNVSTMPTAAAALATMLIVRPKPSKEAPPAPVSVSDGSDDGVPYIEDTHVLPKGRIVGSALCVYYKENHTGTSHLGIGTHSIGRCSMLLD